MTNRPEITVKERGYVKRKEGVLEENGDLEVIVSNLKDVISLKIGLILLNKNDSQNAEL